MTELTDSIISNRTQKFEYDLMNRLVKSSGQYGTETYTYTNSELRTPNPEPFPSHKKELLRNPHLRTFDEWQVRINSAKDRCSSYRVLQVY